MMGLSLLKKLLQKDDFLCKLNLKDYALIFSNTLQNFPEISKICIAGKTLRANFSWENFS